MISLHHDDIFIYDVAGQWAIKGKQELIVMVEDWFKDISLDEVGVDFSNLTIKSSHTCAFAYFDATFSKLKNDVVVQSVIDRFTLCLVFEDGWKIIHQHASHPLGSSH
ncbi:TPA: nuclear transport factor 2 family protein [Streptococcus suis]|nr:nuclear transport factor 2 family protein [Streptococcus suis]